MEHHDLFGPSGTVSVAGLASEKKINITGKGIPLDLQEREYLEFIVKHGRETSCAISKEAEELYDFYQRDHERISSLLFQRPPDWSPQAWAIMQQIQTVVSTVRSNVRLLSDNIGGGDKDAGCSQGKKVVRDFVSKVLKSSSYKDSFQKALLMAYLYGQATVIIEKKSGTIRVTDALYTHLIEHPVLPEVVAVVEHNPRKRCNRCYTEYGFGFFSAIDPSQDSYTPYQNSSVNWLTLYADTPQAGEVYGVSLVRESVKFSKAIMQILYSANVRAKACSASNIIVFEGAANNGSQDGEQPQRFGPFLSYKTREGVSTKALTFPVDIESALKSIQMICALEAQVLGIPSMSELRSHQTATTSELQNSSIIAQLVTLASRAEAFEVSLLAKIINEKFFDGQEQENSLIEKFGIYSHITPVLYKQSEEQKLRFASELLGGGFISRDEAAKIIFGENRALPEVTEKSTKKQEDGQADGKEPEA